MNLFNSVKTQRVSLKTHAPFTREAVKTPDGKFIFRELDNTPILGNADDFTLANQLKSGVKLTAPSGDFFTQSRLVISDIVQDGSDYLLKVSADPVPVSVPVSEPVSEPDSVSEPESA